ncbi:MAG: oligosaccharide flippase family protein [Clostridia bacterium]|nr:oligosaccharide flippase family protein [Clostridia bacterium]
MSRIENSAKNITFTLGNNILTSLLGIISRTVFIATLGSDYLGLAGLLTNILGFLSISELGIATAIGFSLYRPLAEHDYDTVSSLMSIYRRAYRVIAAIVFVCGIGLFFFLDFFIPVEQQPPETDFAYFAFLISTVSGYLFSYKTTLINSDNQAYRIASIQMAASVIQTVLQIIVLLLFKSYVVYLVAHIGCSIVSMLVQNRFITKMYAQVNFYCRDKLSKTMQTELERNIGGLIIGKIGDYLINSTDNLIITKLVSLTATGIYSNYLLIRNMVNGYISTIFSGIAASMGNVVAVESDERKLEIFDTLMFCAFFVYSFEAVCFFCLFNPFIGDIWLGKEYLFDSFTVFIIVINNYLTGLRMPLITMKGAAGKYMEDAWIPFAFAGINLISSIILVKYIGVAGVFLGTIIGSLLTADWYRPIVIYRSVFHAPIRKYFSRYLLYVILGLGYMAGAYGLCSLVNTPFVFVNFVLKCIIAVCVPVLLNVVLFYRTAEIIRLAGRFVKKVISKVRNTNE